MVKPTTLDTGGALSAIELRSIRASLGWPQSRMAAEIGRSLRQYKAYESGEYPISLIVERAVSGTKRNPNQ